GQLIRLQSDSGLVEMEISSVDFPYVTGTAESGHGIVELNLSGATRIELLTAPKRVEVLPLERIRQNSDMLKGARVRFETKKGDVTLRDISRVEQGWVTGQLEDGDGPIRVDLRQVNAVEIRELDRSRSIMKSVGLAAGIVAVAAILVSLTKSSCPIAYIDRGNGWELVGESYAGAAFRSTQRDDLLPLPDLGSASSIRIRLRNEARETQYTDHAELVIVEHAPQLRALSTFDGRVVLVGNARSPVAAHDRYGQDVMSIVSDRDERLMVTDPEAAATTRDDALEDQLTAEFSVPSQGTPVLELVAGNTAWLDLVFGRFFAAMGERLPVYLARGNDSAAGPRIQRWREREGVDLIVELKTGDSWRRVAIVPTVGGAALREVAIPLPLEDSRTPAQVIVRVRGGLGFWRIDRLALSVEDETQAAVRRVQATRAQATTSGDRLAAISATDGDYDTLSEWNESLEMTFNVPPPANGLTRTAFLFTSGYYNVHLPVQAQWQPGTLKAIRDEPGALSRFSRDLAREYARKQAGAKSAKSRVSR
ncbi:MAG TPA: hypothetical protein VGK31_03855, partial [Thermoanaerobaculia bacterium]